eukprot:5142959-Pyramimonas_sp.AAC.1
MQGLHGLRVVPFQNVALALAPRSFVLNSCTSFTASHECRTRHGILERFRAVRAHELLWFAVLKSQEWCSDTVHDRED